MFVAPNMMAYSVFASLASCIGMLMLAYNLIAVVMYMREDSDGSASGLAKAAWLMGIVSLFFSGLPCFGMFLPFIAVILARVERGRIYREESPLAGATPVRMGSLNGGIALLLFAITNAGFITAFATGTSAPTVEVEAPAE